ncbi:hypothetical protein [Rhizohabitans arisaemae]|uniref:hypothetical protein n=1 Tax=Rhizohabitans arisaemae TaxID=2720610 RepID=UPI0024B27754|nr:hypothetical protein [Rhizohabitans arisaemae]
MVCLLLLFGSWFMIGIGHSLDTGWRVLIVLPGMAMLIALPLAVTLLREWMGGEALLTLMLCLLLTEAVRTLPGDWYLRAFGERVTAVVASERERVDDGVTVYDYRLKRIDGRAVNGRLESNERYPVAEHVLVLADPLGVINPRHRGGWAVPEDGPVTLLIFGGLVIVVITAGVRGEFRRRTLRPWPGRRPRNREFWAYVRE